jgi:excisionase family DNA binding protein
MRAVSAPLTAKQMAKALGVAERTIWRWLELGKITCTRLPNGAVRFRECDVQFKGGATK